MTDLDQLLAVQNLDLDGERLRRRRVELAEREELVRLAERAKAAIQEQDAAGAERLEVARDQKRLEDEVATLSDKADSTEKKLYSGEVVVPKELEALQSEIAGMGERRSALEDQILDLMERVDGLDRSVAALETEREDLAAGQERVGEALTVAEAEIDVEIGRVGTERDALAAALPSELMEQYEKLRVSLGGIAVARFSNGVCDACHLNLSAVEVDRIKKAPPDEPVACGECGTLLVR